MASKIELTGYDYSPVDGKFVKQSLIYKEPDSSMAYAHGQPITVDGAKVFIKNYYEQLRSEMGEEKAKNENIAFTFGKETLLSILSQEECVGIKFYIGKRMDYECPIDFTGKWPGKTLVAIGIRDDSKETEIGAEIDYIARGIGGTMSTASKVCEGTQPGLIMEMIPPFTLSDIK